MIIHCPSCRALAEAERAVVDEAGARAGVVCSACKAVAWLTLRTEAGAPPRASGTRIDPLLEEALALPAEDEASAPLLEDLRALAGRWADFDAHKALIQRAQAVGAMPALGVRYRRVLEALPGDEVAQRARQEILNVATASLNTMAGGRSLEDGVAVTEQRRKQAALAILVVVLLALLAWASSDLTLQGL